MLNPSLIKRGLDDEEYSNACPTIGTLMVAHFSTPKPKQHNDAIYGADGLFFATHPARRLYLREAIRNEYDIYTGEEERKERPMLWAAVLLLAPGHHMILPAWRGKAFWRSIETDQDVADALLQMSLRGGLSIAEWYSYICDQRIRKGNKAKSRRIQKGAAIH